MTAVSRIIFFSICACLVRADVMFPFEKDRLDSHCVGSSSGAEGIYRLSKDCKKTESGDETFVGFVINSGPVLCCTKMSSKRYCAIYGHEKPVIDHKIAHGDRSDVGEFPFMAALGYKHFDEIDFDCGGSIIAETFIITAAHCVNRKSRQPKLIRVGRTSLNLSDAIDDSESQDRNVKKIFIHPDYMSSSKYHDIALIQLDEPIEFAEHIKPICLQNAIDDVESARNFTIIGFGTSNVTTRVKSDWLMKAAVQEMPISDCQNDFRALNLPSLQKNVDHSQICARDDKIEGAGDTCPGDSGGPMHLVARNNKYYIVGITSFGLGCGSKFPSVYTRVSSYTDWIENIVWP